ncbi:unnamed protein product, partial [Brenthis ino]
MHPSEVRVYLVPAEESSRNYDSWICGGAIIHPFLVLTSAACIEDVEKAYVIAGYHKYVKLSDLDKNECTKNMKRKIVDTYVPLSYELDYSNIEKWSALDIAVVKVDKQYRFDDQNFTKYCSYPPNKIDVNFDKQNEKPGTQAIVLGWGHTSKWRMEEDERDHNVKELLYGPTIIYPKNECKKYYIKPNLSNIIDKYMICTDDYGLLYDSGATDLTHQYVPELEQMKLEYFTDYDVNSDDAIIDNVSKTNPDAEILGSKPGICQNDHGGPLISWINGTETVLGVASVFRVNQNLECVPPFLFTSTYRNKDLVKCLLNDKVDPNGCLQSQNEENNKILSRRMYWNEQPNSSLRYRYRHRSVSWQLAMPICDQCDANLASHWSRIRLFPPRHAPRAATVIRSARIPRVAAECGVSWRDSTF